MLVLPFFLFFLLTAFFLLALLPVFAFVLLFIACFAVFSVFFC